MTIFEIFVLLSALCVLVYGALRLRNILEGVKLGTVSGALVVVVGFTRYMVYAGILGIFLFFILSLLFTDAPPPPLLQHAFKIQISNMAYGISDIQDRASEVALLYDLTGNVNVVGIDWVISTIFLIAFTIIVPLLHWILSYAEQVLRSIGLRKPFTPENTVYTKKIALFMLCLWFTYSLYQVAMSIYLQSKLQLEGIELEMINISVVDSLFVIGLVYLLSEIFRVGYELQQEQSFTV
jgi:hypothetical protein